MKRFVIGESRSQSTLFPELLNDYVAEDNPVRVIDVFVDELDMRNHRDRVLVRAFFYSERLETKLWIPTYVGMTFFSLCLHTNTQSQTVRFD